jgi:hypothetical protein
MPLLTAVLVTLLIAAVSACSPASSPGDAPDTTRHRALLHELCALMEPSERPDCPREYRDEPDQYIQQAIDAIHRADPAATR